MNRDEKLLRIAGLPPAIRKANHRSVLCPSEPAGGTWIALNDAGVTLALINWYSIRVRVENHVVSRGEVVKAVCDAGSPGEADSRLAEVPLQRINPFRLIGVFPQTHEIIEWQWSLKKLIHQQHQWKSRQWISSGFDEPAAQRIRTRTFRNAEGQKTTGTLAWLRRLHRSHTPECGPFSTCMHRSDAATVSYTEIAVYARRAVMRHHGGAPCQFADSAPRLSLAIENRGGEHHRPLSGFCG